MSKTCVHVPKIEDYRKLVKFTEDSGGRKDFGNHWGVYGKETCIWVEDIKHISYGDRKYAYETNTKIIPLNVYLKNVVGGKIKEPAPAKFLLQYEIDEDPFEEFQTILEIKKRIKELVEEGGHSFVVWEIKKKIVLDVEKIESVIIKGI